MGRSPETAAPIPTPVNDPLRNRSAPNARRIEPIDDLAAAVDGNVLAHENYRFVTVHLLDLCLDYRLQVTNAYDVR